MYCFLAPLHIAPPHSDVNISDPEPPRPRFNVKSSKQQVEDILRQRGNLPDAKEWVLSIFLFVSPISDLTQFNRRKINFTWFENFVSIWPIAVQNTIPRALQKEDNRIRGSQSTTERYKISMTSSFMSQNDSNMTNFIFLQMYESSLWLMDLIKYLEISVSRLWYQKSQFARTYIYKLIQPPEAALEHRKVPFANVRLTFFAARMPQNIPFILPQKWLL